MVDLYPEQMPPPPAPTFSPGFRLLALNVAFVVAHFFLFCNVLRMSRPLELTWAGAFVTLAVGALLPQWWSWPVVLAAAAGLTVVLAAVQLRRPSYHGVGWRWANPRLPEWWTRR